MERSKQVILDHSTTSSSILLQASISEYVYFTKNNNKGNQFFTVNILTLYFTGWKLLHLGCVYIFHSVPPFILLSFMSDC